MIGPQTVEVSVSEEVRSVEILLDGESAGLAVRAPWLVDCDFGNELAVYGRENEPCRRCKTTVIERIKQGGRSTYFCPSCQR